MGSVRALKKLQDHTKKQKYDICHSNVIQRQ